MESAANKMQTKHREDSEIFYRLDNKTTWLPDITLFKECSKMVERFTSSNVLKQLIVSVEQLAPSNTIVLRRECFNENVLASAIVKNENGSEDVSTVMDTIIKGEPSNQSEGTNKQHISFPDNDVKLENVMEGRAETFCNVVSDLLHEDTNSRILSNSHHLSNVTKRLIIKDV